MADLLYPIYPRPSTLTERLALALGFTVGFCSVCGKFALIRAWQDDFRETGFCSNCGSSNRNRQIAYTLCKSVVERRSHFESVAKMSKLSQMSIYNTEASGPLHAYLSQIPGYVCSEYFGSEYAAGEMVGGIRHEDLTKLSFPDNSLDVVISSDVLEHVSLPYRAHNEILRVLKVGGRHIFTVPFLDQMYNDEIFAEPRANGEIKFLKTPIYHIDGKRAEGSLVYRYFSLEMLSQLATIGFRTNMYRLYHPTLGILGNNGIVFEAIKVQGGAKLSDNPTMLKDHIERVRKLKELPNQQRQ